MKRIGLLGGTFDPPHLGHLTIAKEALHSLELDELWFIPTYEPPHKTEASTCGVHRLNMLELMIVNETGFQIKTIELERKGKSYTIDTINELLTEHSNVMFYFIIGADQVRSLHRWHQIDELLTKVQFVGVERPGVIWHETIPVQKLSVKKTDVSSTMIRNKINDGKNVEHLLKQNVYAYIKEHHLYGYRKNSAIN